MGFREMRCRIESLAYDAVIGRSAAVWPEGER